MHAFLSWVCRLLFYFQNHLFLSILGIYRKSTKQFGSSLDQPHHFVEPYQDQTVCKSSQQTIQITVNIIGPRREKTFLPGLRTTQPQTSLRIRAVRSAPLLVVMGGTIIWGHFFKPEKNLEFFRLKNDPIDAYPGKLE